jgi:hypothetical protein
MTRTLMGLVVGLAAAGGLALAGLAVPVASGYLAARALTPGGEVISVTTPPMVRVKFVPSGDTRPRLTRQGKTMRSQLIDPDCGSPQGWV